MDNKYGLGSAKVATEHHETHHKPMARHACPCKHCGGPRLVSCPTVHDHRCEDCGELQCDIPKGYSSGRSGSTE